MRLPELPLLRLSFQWFVASDSSLWAITANYHQFSMMRPQATEQPVGTSFRNPLEASLIMKRLGHLDRKAQKRSVHLTVGVLAGYLAQADLLSSRLRSLGEDRWSALKVEILTVDAAQGK